MSDNSIHQIPVNRQPGNEYAKAYITSLRTAEIGELLPPENDRANGEYPVLKQLYEIHRNGGKNAVADVIGTIAHNYPWLKAIVTPPRFKLYTPAEIMARPPIEYLDSERLIPERSLILLYGAPGTGKSLWAMSRLVSIAESRRVVYVASEGQGGLAERYAAAQKAAGKPIPDALATVDQAVNLTDPAAVDAFIEAIRAFKPALVCFDTLAGAMIGADENSSADMTTIVDSCHRITAETGAAVMLVHHTRKDGASYRGHSSLHGAADAMYELTESDGLITFRCMKAKDSRPPEARCYRIVEFETRPGQTGAALLPSERVAVDQNKLTAKQQKVMEALDGFTGGVRYTTLRDATGFEKSSLLAILRKLIARGYVNQGASGEPYYLTEAGRNQLSNLTDQTGTSGTKQVQNVPGVPGYEVGTSGTHTL